MRTLISGQGGIAFLTEENAVTSIDIDGARAQRTEHEVSWLLRDLTDIEVFEDVTQEQTIAELEAAWQRDRAMHLMLILLDGSEEAETRQLACECLSEFLTVEHSNYLANYFYAAPLPLRSDLQGALQYSRKMGASNLETFLLALETDQEEIARRCVAWDALPLELFDNEQDKYSFKVAAAKAGAFRLFVKERHKSDYALFQMLVSPEFRGQSKARRIFVQWAAPFKERVGNVRFTDDEDDALMEEETLAGQRPGGGYYVYLNVEKQKESIKSLLSKGQRTLAFKCIRELIESQRPRSKPEHISKSLCDLAQYSKHLGDSRLQLRLSEWAAKELPTDGWAYAQVGDAYRALGEYPKSLSAYQRAGALGHKAIALSGRAAVLKDLGEFNEALEIFDACIREFPNEVAARSGRAEVIKELGRLEEALSIYDEIVAEFPHEVFPLNGRANVLRDLGRIEEALVAYNEILRVFPNELVTLDGRTEVLRHLGRLDEALREFEIICKNFPLDPVSRIGRANVLKDLGNFEEALKTYDDLIHRFRMYPAGYNGRADVLKKQNKLAEAAAAYRENLRRFPKSMTTRNGLASVLAAMERYAEALRLLPANRPATLGEWVAFHIRAVILLRKGDIDTAIENLQWGVNEIPWPNQKQYFETALAGARIRKAQYTEALNLLSREFHPTLKPIAMMFQLHAYSELGEHKKAKAALDLVSGKSSPVIIQARDALAVRYGFTPDKANPNSDKRLFEQECDTLLLAA